MVTSIIPRLMIQLGSGLILLVASSLPALALTSVHASVDRNPVIVGQSFQLEISADDDVSQNKLDLSALQQDFRVGQPRVSRSTRVINLEASRETRWSVMLIAQQAGTVIIPAFTLDGISSEPITLSVLSADQAQAQGEPEWVFLQTGIEQRSLWLNQPTQITLKLFLGAELQSGSLTSPSSEHAIVRQLGQDRESTQIVKGRRYRVIERDFIVVPQRAGTIELKPASFEGNVVLPTARRDFFGMASAQPMVVQGQTIALEVQAKPQNYQGDWLVAKQVTLSDRLSEQAQYFVGQPITRTLQIHAIDAVEESLSELTFAPVSGLKIYPDKVERQGSVQNGQPVAILQQSVAIVPAQAGELTLPEQRLAWFNSLSGQQEWAVLPARTISVKANPDQISQAAPPMVNNASAPPQLSPQGQSDASFWPGLTALFALLWLATLYWGWQRKSSAQSLRVATPAKAKDQANLTALVNACEHNDVEQVLQLLPLWASQQAERPLTLAQISQIFPELAPELAALQRSRYSSDGAQWQGQALAQYLKKQTRNGSMQKTSVLPPLHPPTTLKE